ncbi:SET domain-containing protein 4 isoform X2 [Poecilia reticulata]|uniref:SET domain-containing protein 4 isoform X2 n=1 Tax=Poecilia reticulata TaxID=8081 RepID=UPI0004A41E0D|nr:PREDICTED: SET domain-containing protein 4 isoform X2 [Poecilia reticulata]
MKGRSRRVGRTARKRKRKREQSVRSVSLSHQLQYVRLVRFLHRRGFSSTLLQPALFSDEVVDVLPAGVRRRGLEQREAVREMHSSNQEFFRTLQPVLSRPPEDVLTYEALRWAWCSVNTRSVFMPRPSSCFLSGPDSYALAPFLDLLNHRPDVQVKAGFNDQTKCYEIRSVCGTPCYEQAYINYGSHDNQRLLLEYGFVAMNNPHSVVYVEPDLLCDILRGEKSLDQKMKFLRENQFLENLTVSSEGPSWRLMVALRLLSLPQTLYHLWRSVLLGQVVDEKTEVRSSQTARTLCQQLLKDTHIALDKISQLLGQYGGPVREQLEVVRALRQEERWILESCVTALKDSVI